MSLRQVATTSSLLSLLDMVVPLVTGALADMSGNFRCRSSGRGLLVIISLVPCRAVFQLVTLLGGVSSMLLCHVSHVSPLLPYLTCRVLVDVSRAAAVCLTEGTTSILVK